MTAYEALEAIRHGKGTKQLDHIVIRASVEIEVEAEIELDEWRAAAQGTAVPGDDLTREQLDLVQSALRSEWEIREEEEADEQLCEFTIYDAQCAGGCGNLIEYDREDSPAPADS